MSIYKHILSYLLATLLMFAIFLVGYAAAFWPQIVILTILLGVVTGLIIVIAREIRRFL